MGRDLQDTLKAHWAERVGMAANMIGEKKNIIIVNMGFSDGVNSNLATAIRTMVVVVMAWGMVFLTHAQSALP